MPEDRTPQDYAIEFGEYLAKRSEQFLDTVHGYLAGTLDDSNELGEAGRAMASAIHDFRKRTARLS